ncbi:MAG TPA: lactoylglutathione lyase [Bacteroidia bacterium]|nr:lactoylglutathione lyase [Bacteroidia bacterium]HRD37509.1 lactoylglutathione lyase [Bacteroidia bacterium]
MEVEIILYVSNLEKSKVFYSLVLNQQPVLDVPGMVEFELGTAIKLGLMPESGIAKIICPILPHPSSTHGKPRCELYFKCPDYQDYFNRALSAGALLISPVIARDWGHIVGYLADYDGHVLAFAGDY